MDAWVLNTVTSSFLIAAPLLVLVLVLVVAIAAIEITSEIPVL